MQLNINRYCVNHCCLGQDKQLQEGAARSSQRHVSGASPNPPPGDPRLHGGPGDEAGPVTGVPGISQDSGKIGLTLNILQDSGKIGETLNIPQYSGKIGLTLNIPQRQW